MSESNTRWTLLVGINFYATRPLRGCVNDVNMIKQYLRSDATNNRVTVLTATKSPDPAYRQPVEQQSAWPTQSNIRSHLEEIIQSANAGDLVYIHYSGHGSRRPTPAHKPYGHSDTGDVALVVLNDDASANEDFPGFALAMILKRMVKKGLLVTLVLDCCFSGHVYRQDGEQNTTIRTLGPISAIGELPVHSNRSHTAQQTFRDAQPLPRWLVDPEGYKIISACGPHEIAQETAFDGAYHGVLSFFLHHSLVSLRNQQTAISHQTFLGNLVNSVQSRVTRQTPTHCGTQRFSFFEGISREPISDFIPVSGDNSRLCLEAGSAHGVCCGDTFALYPFFSPENAIEAVSLPSFEAKVLSLTPFTSELEAPGSASMSNAHRDGWKAKALTSSFPPQVQVGLTQTMDNKAEWSRAALGRHFFQIMEEPSADDQCEFFLDRAQDGNYRILNSAHQMIPSILPIPLDSPAEFQPVIEILEHLATFKYIEGIKSPISTLKFQSDFHLDLEDASQRFYSLDAVLDIKENQDLKLTIKNKSKDSPLYATILNLTPMWQIQCLTADEGNSGYLTIPPEGDDCTDKGTIEWSMAVPGLLRPQQECEDKIKIILTTHPTSFHTLLLPKIVEPVEHRLRTHQPTFAWIPLSGQPTSIGRQEDYYIATLVIRTHV
ncbi:hypothetical protein LT330_005205 [Penicillium expansum]|nr:hypothetical protein LT330_005205 [Penicillium expansum]